MVDAFTKQWCRRRGCMGCKCTPKCFDLSKIMAKSLKIWEKSQKSGQKWCPTLFDFKKWRPTFAEKHMKIFVGGHTKKRSS